MNDSVIRTMRSLVDPHAIEVDDTTLLQRFVGLGDSEAFELLLWRHIGLVRQTCRAVLRDRHAAEDVVQAVFLVLARKAGSIQEGTSCAGWLHRTAYRASLRASSILRNKRTVTMTDIGVIVEPASPEPIAFPMSEVVHEEIDRLPRKYRMPIVLCYLEGLSQSEAAERLGWPVGTVNGRIGRAKQMLESRLLLRGIRFVLTASLLAVEKGDAAFVSRTLRAALMYARGLNSTSGISPLTLSLANGVIRSMLFKQFQIVASLVTLAGVMVFGIAFAGADEPHQIPKTPLPASAPTPPQNASAVVKKIRIDDAAITKYKNAGAKFYGLVPIAEADFLGGSRKLKNDEGKPNRIFGLIFKQVPRIESSWEATKLRTMRMPSHACRSKLFHL